MKELIIFLTISLCTFFGFSASKVKAETSIEHNKQEFRGVWVATVANIDIGKHLSEQQYKEEFTKILDKVEEFNFNAIIFQVRPTNDAFYPSTLNPWSKYLTGAEGLNPGWDPLYWMVEETHKRGIEFHAWLNPYRISTEKIGENYMTKEALISSLSNRNFAKIHPDLVLVGGDNKLILNPGEEKVKQFIQDSINEIITNYDVDAIHFDDYFYPYSGVLNNGDNTTYQANKYENESLADWRRRNVDEVIENISKLIRAHNEEKQTAVQFGISPFGVWRNSSTDPRGSNTKANQSYDAQYADTRKWVKEEWIDYIVPQLYWEIGHSLADYKTLATWWADVVKGTNVNLYTGNALYRYGTNDAWSKYDELPKQLLFNNEFEEIKGSVFFSYKHLNSASSSALITGRDFIKKRMWDTLALQPKLPMINNTIPGTISNLAISTSENKTSFDISWDKVDNSKFYVVYRFEKGQQVDLSKPENIYSIVLNDNHSSTVSFTDSNIEEGKEYVYHVSVVNNGVVEGPAKTISYSSQDNNPTDNNNQTSNENTPLSNTNIALITGGALLTVGLIIFFIIRKFKAV